MPRFEQDFANRFAQGRATRIAARHHVISQASQPRFAERQLGALARPVDTIERKEQGPTVLYYGAKEMSPATGRGIVARAPAAGRRLRSRKEPVPLRNQSFRGSPHARADCWGPFFFAANLLPFASVLRTTCAIRVRLGARFDCDLCGASGCLDCVPGVSCQ